MLQLTKLAKGTPLNLSKADNSLTELRIGLSWDSVEGKNIDLDASLVILNKDSKMLSEDSICYFAESNMSLYNDAIKLSGDNRTGKGDGEDESILIRLKEIPLNACHLVAAITIFNEQPQQNGILSFDMIQEAKAVLYNNKTNTAICEFSLSQDENFRNQTAIIMAMISRSESNENEWIVNALGTPVKAASSTPDQRGICDVLAFYK